MVILHTFTALFVALAAAACNTALYSSAGQTCLSNCTPLTDPCQRQQCFVFCAKQEGNADCLQSSTAACQTVASCECNNVPSFGVGITPASGVVAFGCDSVAQTNSFVQCYSTPNSPCSQLLAFTSPALASQDLQCQCAFQMQTCQANNVPCQNPNFGTSNFFQQSCLANCAANQVNAFHSCCTTPGSACALNPASCDCAQQVQTCQAQFYPCQNIGLGTSAYLSSTCSTCSSAVQLSSFHTCCAASGSACATLNSQYPYGGAPSALACNCSLQVQQCQQANSGCQNQVLGAAQIVATTCASCSSSSALIGFQNCVNLATSSCGQIESTYPFGNAPTALLCQCAQQVQACQSQAAYQGCVNADWGTQTFLNNVCGGGNNNNNNNNGYGGNNNGYYRGSASVVSLSALLALFAIIASMM